MTMTMATTRSNPYDVIGQTRAAPLPLIYELETPDDDARVSIEVLGQGARSGPWRQAFERDVAIVSLLRPECALEVLDISDLPDGTSVMTSALPAGESLACWLDEGRTATPDQVLEVVTGLAQGLHAAHERGVSHGAITADAVMLATSTQHPMGVPRLRGFGQRWLRAAVQPGSQPPTSSEMGAPTSRASRSAISGDVAALALLAERLLTSPELRDATGGRSFGTSPAVTAVIAAAVDRDGPYRSPLNLAAALAKAIAADAASDDPTPDLDIQPVRRASRSSLLMAGLAAAFVSVAGIQVMKAFRQQPYAATAAYAVPTIVLASLPDLSPQPALAPAVVPEPRAVTVVAPRVKPPRAHGARRQRDEPPAKVSVWSTREQRVVFVNVGSVVE
jgi:hypothetical protein